ncbi:MAG: hypothetical protein M1837_002998 [Sclerophora amabilis]|nr:MAG: hypothetical protein M1837_002998 [Sclerophora amabilis]
MAKSTSPPSQFARPGAYDGRRSPPDDLAPPQADLLTRAATIANTVNFRDRRRSSMLSELPLEETRRSVQNATTDVRRSLWSSTDDLLQPKPEGSTPGLGDEDSKWHTVPLGFALIPACVGVVFKNGSSVITDIMLLGLAGVFLHWSVRLPWDWYNSSRSTLATPSSLDTSAEHSEAEDEEILSPTSEGSTAKAGLSPSAGSGMGHRTMSQKEAWKELRGHEMLSLFSCFFFPMLGAYLLHAIRCHLSRPSESVVSNFSLTIFLLAAEVRPVAHVLKLIRARTLYLQRIVNEIPDAASPQDRRVGNLEQRLAELESQIRADEASQTSAVGSRNSKVTTAKTEVRKSIQPDLDALNRAVRRHEHRAALQIAATEGRLFGLEEKVNNAVSLAAVAAQREQRQRPGFIMILSKWIGGVMTFFFRTSWETFIFPFQMIGRALEAAVSATMAAILPSRKAGRLQDQERLRGRGRPLKRRVPLRAVQ